ncbi:MAG: hypothetical protein ACI4PK_03965 [Oscillospiraceae bacterium]
MARNLSAYEGSKELYFLGERPIIVEQFKWQNYNGIKRQKKLPKYLWHKKQ